MFLMALGLKITIFVIAIIAGLYLIISLIAGIAYFRIMLARSKQMVLNTSHDPVDFEIVGAEDSPLLPDVKLLKAEQARFKEILKNKKYQYLEQTSSRGLKLVGWYFPSERKENEKVKVVVFCHGWKSNGLADFSCCANFYFDYGYDVLIIDHQAHCHSEGKYLGFGVLDSINTLKWVKMVDQMHQGNCFIYLHGISMGANTVMLMANKDLPKSVKGIVSDCGFTSGYDEMTYLSSNMHTNFLLARQIIWLLCKLICHYDLRISSIDALKEAKVPVLFIHGDKDNFVPLEASKKNYEVCSNKKMLHIFPGCYHAGCFINNKEEYTKLVIDFLNNL